MKKNTIQINTKKQGFIALFFTLGVSSILLAYIVTSSSSVFDLMRMRQSFFDERNTTFKNIQCADGFIDTLLRHGVSMSNSIIFEYSFVFENTICTISNISFINISPNIQQYFFIFQDAYVNLTIENGFISTSSISHISL